MVEVTREMVDVVVRVSRRYDELPHLGRDDLVGVALERLVPVARRRDVLPLGLVATIANRAMIDELRRVGGMRRRRVGVDLPRFRDVPLSLDAVVGEEGGWDGYAVLGREQLFEVRGGVARTLNGLTTRQKRIVVLLGLGFNMREISEYVGVSESRVCQIVDDVRWKLRPAKGFVEDA